MGKVKLLFSLMLFCLTGLLFAQTFQFPITVTDGINTPQVLKLGMSCAGTDGLDTGLDQPAPPSFPPPPSFGARLFFNFESYFADFRANTISETQYGVQYQADQGGTIVLTWDNTAIPSVGTFIMKDPIIEAFTLDMSTTNTFTPTDDGFGGNLTAGGVNIFVTALAPASPPLFDGADVTINISEDGVLDFSEMGEETAVDIEFNNVSGSGTVNVKSFSSEPINHNIPATHVSKYRWEITTNGFTFSNAQLRIITCEIPNAGIGNPQTVDIYKRDTPGTGSFTLLSTTAYGDILMGGVTSFSEFALGSEDPDNPLPVELTNFAAYSGDNRVTLKWTTQSETNNSGFEVFRSLAETGYYEIIASYENQLSLVGAGSSNEPHDYEYKDSYVVNGTTYWYKIADVDFNGIRSYHGPVSAVPNGNGTPVSQTNNAPTRFMLYQNYPNPFNPGTTIKFELPERASNLQKVDLRIFNSLGKQVRTLYSEPLAPGVYEIKWDGMDDQGNRLSSGIYLVRFKAGAFSQARKMFLLK